MGFSTAFVCRKEKKKKTIQNGKPKNSYCMQRLCSDSPPSKNNDNTKHLKLINDRILGRCPVCNQLTLSSSQKEYELQF